MYFYLLKLTVGFVELHLLIFKVILGSTRKIDLGSLEPYIYVFEVGSEFGNLEPHSFIPIRISSRLF